MKFKRYVENLQAVQFRMRDEGERKSVVDREIERYESSLQSRLLDSNSSEQTTPTREQTTTHEQTTTYEQTSSSNQVLSQAVLDSKKRGNGYHQLFLDTVVVA